MGDDVKEDVKAAGIDWGKVLDTIENLLPILRALLGK